MLYTKEYVRILCDNSVGRERSRRKILHVESNDRHGAGLDSSREDMTIIRVWQRQTANSVLVVANIGLGQDAIHDVTRKQQTLACCAAVGTQAPDPFLMNRLRPTRHDNMVDAELHEQIPKMEGIQQVRVIQNNRRRSRLAVRVHAPPARPYPPVTPPEQRALALRVA
jgi:hypothetical protein